MLGNHPTPTLILTTNYSANALFLYKHALYYTQTHKHHPTNSHQVRERLRGRLRERDEVGKKIERERNREIERRRG